MDTIWLVSQGEYSDYSIVGAFSTEARAQKFADHVNADDPYANAGVQEMFVDVPEVQWYSTSVIMDAKGRLAEDPRTYFSVYPAVSTHAWWVNGRGVGHKMLMLVQVPTQDTQRAIKRANEIRSQVLATWGWGWPKDWEQSLTRPWSTLRGKTWEV